MPVKGGNAVRANYRKKIDEINSKRVKAAVTKIITYAAGASKEIAPIEFGNLINSQFRNIEKTSTGWRGTLGYTVGYAAALENPKSGGRLDGWQPKPPEDKFGPAWNPISQQGFLRLAFTGQEAKQTIEKIIQGIKLK